jgi:hypothetical protein
MANSVLQKIIQTGAKVVEGAAPIVGGIVAGPAGAAAGKTLATGVKKIASNTHLGGSGSTTGHNSFTPSSAASLGEARSQDKARMQQQYGMGGADNEIG